jgi:hypothetical protein
VLHVGQLGVVDAALEADQEQGLVRLWKREREEREKRVRIRGNNQ